MQKEAAAFHAQLERAYLRTLRAVTAIGPEGKVVGDARGQIESDLAAIERRLDEIPGDDLPMARLAARLALPADIVDFLWTAVAVAADPRIHPHLHGLVGSEARRELSLAAYAIIAGMVGDRARSLAASLGPSHPLRALGFVVTSEPRTGRSAAGFGVDDALIDFLQGRSPSGDGAHAIVLKDDRKFDPLQRAALRRIAEALAVVDASPIVVIQGRIDSGRRTAAATVAADLDRPVRSLDLMRLGTSLADLSDALLVHQRECILRDAIPLLAEVDDLADAHQDGSARMRLLARTLDAIEGPVFVTTSRPGLDLGTRRRVLRVDWPLPDHPTRRALWQDQLGDDADAIGDDLDRIAHRYLLGPGGIERAVGTARLLASAEGREAPAASDLVAGIRNDIAERVGELARRVEVRQSWDDVVLSDDLQDQVRGLIARVRHAHRVYEDWGFHAKSPRGIGVPALFSGPPGTGKTMVASIIARELDLELLQVDLSQVVSKWIGETEKQLAKVFDAAEAGHALLLFDEADALFAKRTTDVKGATDRYANLEVNYLLQRVEAFGGIVILTTNLDTSIDPALKRRLAAHVVFWPPDEDEREELWRRMLSTGSAPVALEELDLETLARNYPDMTGANIRNAVLAAAFLAAAEDARITQVHLERAAKGEYRTMGRVLR